MSRLILTFDESGAGSLKAAGRADLVVAFVQRFVSGRLRPASELTAFLSPRSADEGRTDFHWLSSSHPGLAEARADGLGLAEFCGRFDTVELWIDSDPNAQLQLAWLLDHLGTHAHIVSKLALVQSDVRIGTQEPAEWMRYRAPVVPINDDHLDLARAAWSAWRASTPVAWSDLLTHNISALPQLRSGIIALLEELPGSRSGLGATEMRMLEILAASGTARPFDLFPGRERLNERTTFDYWEVGALLDGLARGPNPAIVGLDEGPFDPDMHDDDARRTHYASSQLSLTDLGKATLAQTDDFSRHNPVDRWWGGTHLTNDRLWRWDLQRQRLVAP